MNNRSTRYCARVCSIYTLIHSSQSFGGVEKMEHWWCVLPSLMYNFLFKSRQHIRVKFVTKNQFGKGSQNAPDVFALIPLIMFKNPQKSILQMVHFTVLKWTGLIDFFWLCTFVILWVSLISGLSLGCITYLSLATNKALHECFNGSLFCQTEEPSWNKIKQIHVDFLWGIKPIQIVFSKGPVMLWIAAARANRYSWILWSKQVMFLKYLK